MGKLPARAHLYIAARCVRPAGGRDNFYSNNSSKRQQRRVAIFHLAAQVIGRSSGRSATAAAAYRAGARIDDARTGEIHDYTRKHGVREAFILAPENAAPWMLNRAGLWNGIEAVEKRKDAQLCREIEIGLPAELEHQDRRTLLVEFIQEEFIARGMIADVAMHAPGREGDRRNEHAHILLTMRQIEGGGFGNKARDWNDPALVETWRANWAERVNHALKAHGVAERIDHRSYARQAVAIGEDPRLTMVPAVHLGPRATQAERHGIRTVPGDLNRAAEVINLELERERVTRMRDRVNGHQSKSQSDQLSRGLQKLLQLSEVPTAAVAQKVIKHRRESLALDKQLLVQDNTDFLFWRGRAQLLGVRSLELERAQRQIEARMLEIRERAVKAREHQQSRQSHKFKTWLRDWGRKILKSPSVETPESVKEEWTQARMEREQIVTDRRQAQRREQEAQEVAARVKETAEAAAWAELRDQAAQLDEAEMLANDLQHAEEEAQCQEQNHDEQEQSSKLELRHDHEVVSAPEPEEPRPVPRPRGPGLRM